jgi:HSP20 family protein
MLPMLRFSRPALLAEDFLRNNFLDDLLDTDSGYNTAAVNIVEGKEDFTIEVAAPGLAKEDYKINLNHNVLTISSSKENKKEEKNDKYTRKEFSYSSFSRSFTLPESVEPEKISASCKDGILYVNIPKREEAKVKPPREIAIA